MKPSAEEFLNHEKKAITIIGMSGLGKTHISAMLARHGWMHYSCDGVIGRDCLAQYLDAPVTKQDLSALSRFIGQFGDPAQGGLSLGDFKKRQKLYYDAECFSIRNAGEALRQAPSHFINDTTGSFCEIENEELIRQAGEETLFVYVEADEEEEKLILQRAIDYPKPMYFPPSKLKVWIEEYTKGEGVSPDKVSPDSFARWVVPRLFKERLPKYRRLADLYGITVPSAKMKNAHDEKSFLNIIAEGLRTS